AGTNKSSKERRRENIRLPQIPAKTAARRSLARNVLILLAAQTIPKSRESAQSRREPQVCAASDCWGFPKVHIRKRKHSRPIQTARWLSPALCSSSARQS